MEHLDIYDAEPDTSGIDGESIDVVDAVPGGRRGGRGGGGGGGGRRAGSGGDASPAGGRFLGMF